MRSARPRRARAKAKQQKISARPHRALLVAVTSAVPGAGCSTVAANLAAGLARDGHRVAAVELGAGGALQLHFGLDPRRGHGARKGKTAILARSPHGLAGPPLTPRKAAALLRQSGRPVLLPFAVPAANGPPPRVSTLADPAFLRARLQPLLDAGVAFVICDTSSAGPQLVAQALAAADEVLLIVPAANLNQSAVADAETLLQRHPPALAQARRASWLINRFSAGQLCDDASLLRLQDAVGGRALPFILEEDPTVPQARREGRLLHEIAEDSRVCLELRALGRWLSARR